MGGGGGSASTAQTYAAVAQAQLSAEQLNWAKQVYADEAPQREAAATQAQQISDANLAQMQQQMAITQQAQDDYESTYHPLEQQIVAAAENYDTPERRAAESAKAVAGVEQNLAQQRGATEREQERAGVNPASGRMADLQASLDLNAAKMKAGAGNAAADAVEQQGYARRMDAANLGRNIASSQATNTALGLQAGQAATSASAAGLAAANSGNSVMTSGYAGAQQGLSGVSGNLASIAGQSSAAAANKNSQIAAGVGAAATIASAVVI